MNENEDRSSVLVFVRDAQIPVKDDPGLGIHLKFCLHSIMECFTFIADASIIFFLPDPDIFCIRPDLGGDLRGSFVHIQRHAAKTIQPFFIDLIISVDDVPVIYADRIVIIPILSLKLDLINSDAAFFALFLLHVEGFVLADLRIRTGNRKCIYWIA